MLVGNLNHPNTYEHFASHPVWKQALDWLQTEAEGKADGDYEIQGRNLYASVQTIKTLPREEGLFEAHKKYIDIHYCLEGGELIGWTPVQNLNNAKEVNEEKDFILYASPASYSLIHATPGVLAICLPEDAHMPKLSDGQNPQVKKVVMKIAVDLLE